MEKARERDIEGFDFTLQFNQNWIVVCRYRKSGGAYTGVLARLV
jgi:hypothetical protein